ncbi:PRC-barrel domain-containing protein [Oricola thermophila]|uniref:PRC-barrel domain-containing protein n=1 Tax=Oricola thermophila TaxID=2742145 RepID=A0A6N1VET2_9HYPH|nr:PRC-barrel domain-containing protein [Oricola thermophila]QKV19033.1 PRC-barrel domain-containing protein [Oricola thermophila]
MKKHLLATTAALALIAKPAAFAQDASGATESSPVFSRDSGQYLSPVDGFYNADPSQVLATRFIGANIHTSTAESAETIGDVNDIIMTPDGRAVAVIVGVGGFLGIGEKEVAMSIDELQWQSGADGEMVLVGGLSKQDLEGAPAFDRSALERDEMASAETRMEGDAAMDKDDTMTSATPKMETVPASEAQLEASEIIGMSVTGAGDETVGEVSEILIDNGGRIEALIIDVGGFLGINEKPTAVSLNDLQFARAEGSDGWSTIRTGLTRESLESQPAYSEETYKSDRDAVILIAPVE